jgi:hypothetical protein
MDMDLARDFVACDADIKEYERKAKTLKAERAMLAEQLMDQMVQEGVSTFKIDGKTVYLHSQSWANAKLNEEGTRDFPSACEALITCGYSDFVETKFSTQRVSALIRELEKDPAGIPPELTSTLDITEKVDVRVRGNKQSFLKDMYPSEGDDQ